MLSQIHSYVTTDTWSIKPHLERRPNFVTVKHLQVCSCGAPSLMRGWVCRFNCSLSSPASHSGIRVLWDSWPCSAVSDSRLPLWREDGFVENSYMCTVYKCSASPSFAKQIMSTLFILCCKDSLVTWMVVSMTAAKFKPVGLASFCPTLWTCLFCLKTQSQSHTATDCQPISVELHLGLMTRYLLLFDSYGLGFVERSLRREDESVFCTYVYAAGPRQRSLSRVRDPWHAWSYFIVSDSKLPFSSPPTTRKVTVEVFYPASTKVFVCENLNWFSLYKYDTDHRENTASSSSSIVSCVSVVWVGCHGNVFTDITILWSAPLEKIA
jgi:hypothetical protein